MGRVFVVLGLELTVWKVGVDMSGLLPPGARLSCPVCVYAHGFEQWILDDNCMLWWSEGGDVMGA